MLTPKKILVIGLGEIGYSNAEYFSSIGIRVDGYDISEDAIRRAISRGVIAAKAKDFSGYDGFIVCISTHNPKDMFMPQMEGLYKVAERLADEADAGGLVSIESTVTQGASRNVCDIIGHKLHVAHVPHRYFNQEKEKHGVKQLRVLGGCRPCCVAKTLIFYKDILGIPLYPVSRVEYAELTKVIENSERFLRIAYAEELRMFCDDNGLNFDELRTSVNTKWNAEILEARNGIGGHCLPKDSQMYLDIINRTRSSSLLATAKVIDMEYRSHIAEGKPSLNLKTDSSNPKREEKKHVVEPLRKINSA